VYSYTLVFSLSYAFASGIALHALGPRRVVLSDLPEIVSVMNSNIALNDILLHSDSQRHRDVDGSRTDKCDLDKPHSYLHNVTAQEFVWGSSVLSPSPSCKCDRSSNEELHAEIDMGRADISDDATIKMPIVNNFDVVVASDVVYYPEAYQPLVDTLCQLLVDRKVCRVCGGSKLQQEGDDESTVTIKPICILAHRNRHPDDHIFFNMIETSCVLSMLPIQRLELNPQSDGHVETTLDDVKLFCISLKSVTSLDL
jgi:hypothetical protein